jgi:putative endonuclease
MYYVYLLQSIKCLDEKYVGFTENVSQRLIDHNSGKSHHTKEYKPWRLVMFIGFQEKIKALNFEKYLKSGSGRSFAQKRFW